MRRPSVWLLFALWAGCAADHAVGGPCSTSKDCASGLACVAMLPGGYCSADCSAAMCGAGQTCTAFGGLQLCFKNCSAAGDCRGGYQCFGGVCQPACASDGDCGRGYTCQGGTCTPRPGAPLGASCATNDDCSSGLCLRQTCQAGCARDGDCASTQTCFLDPLGDGDVPAPTTHLAPVCIDRRGKAAPGSSCSTDADCDRGSCQLGLCVQLCATSADCAASGAACTTMVASLDNRSNPTYKGCLPGKGVIDFDGAGGQIPLPASAQSFAIYAHVDPFDFNNAVGVVQLSDGSGADLYDVPQSVTDFYALTLRYEPTEGSSTMLVPNTPKVTLMPGVYTFMYGAQSGATPTVRVYLKLAPQPIASGSVPLNLYVTDLTGACQSLSFADVQNGALAGAVSQLQRVYAQANVTVGPVRYIDVSSVPNTIRFNISMTGPMLPDLDNELAAATAGRGTTVGFDVVLLRSITDQNGGQSGVLGAAGGIPTNPVLGTQHSGVVVSLETLCLTNMSTFGSTMGHELGHSVGLFHSVEQDGNHDPLTDTAADGQNNLMYWLESSGSHLSPEQGQVIRNDPKVQP